MNHSNVKINFIYNMLNKIVNLIVPFLLTPYLSRVLGVEKVGEYSFSFSIITFFVLVATLGTDIYGQREISYSQNDINKKSQCFMEILFLRLLLFVITFVAFIFSYFILNLSFLYLILSLNIFNVLLDISWFYSGIENFRYICVRNIIIKILSAIFVVIFVKSKNDLNIYSFIISIFAIVSSIVLWIDIPKHIDLSLIKRIDFIKHLKGSLILFVPTIAITLYTVFDKTMIGMFDGSYVENGYYEQAYKIVCMALKGVTALSYVLMPRIAALNSENRMEDIKKYLYLSIKYLFLFTIPVMIGLIVISPYFVPWFFGDEFSKTIIILQIMSPLVVIIGISNTIGIQFLVPTKRDDIYIKSVIFGSITNVLLNFIFIPKYFAIGATISSIVSELVVTLYQLYKVREIINLKEFLFCFGKK